MFNVQFQTPLESSQYITMSAGVAQEAVEKIPRQSPGRQPQNSPLNLWMADGENELGHAIGLSVEYW